MLYLASLNQKPRRSLENIHQEESYTHQNSHFNGNYMHINNEQDVITNGNGVYFQTEIYVYLNIRNGSF